MSHRILVPALTTVRVETAGKPGLEHDELFSIPTGDSMPLAAGAEDHLARFYADAFSHEELRKGLNFENELRQYPRDTIGSLGRRAARLFVQDSQVATEQTLRIILARPRRLDFADALAGKFAPEKVRALQENLAPPARRDRTWFNRPDGRFVTCRGADGNSLFQWFKGIRVNWADLEADLTANVKSPHYFRCIKGLLVGDSRYGMLDERLPISDHAKGLVQFLKKYPHLMQRFCEMNFPLHPFSINEDYEHLIGFLHSPLSSLYETKIKKEVMPAYHRVSRTWVMKRTLDNAICEAVNAPHVTTSDGAGYYDTFDCDLTVPITVMHNEFRSFFGKIAADNIDIIVEKFKTTIGITYYSDSNGDVIESLAGSSMTAYSRGALGIVLEILIDHSGLSINDIKTFIDDVCSKIRKSAQE